MDISKILQEKEGLRLEFKSELPEPDKLARELVAFSNTKGGIVVIGYDGIKRKMNKLRRWSVRALM